MKEGVDTTNGEKAEKEVNNPPMAENHNKERAPYGNKLPLSKRRKLRRKIKSHDFAGNRYKIIWKKPEEGAWGLCEDNAAPEKTLHVSPI